MSNSTDARHESIEEFRYRSQGTELFAFEAGQGEPIVFLHGGLADHRASVLVVGPLISSYRIIIPDVRGAGRSTHHGELDWDCLANDVAHLLDAMQLDRAVVGGSSAGSAIALRFGLLHGDRARGLALVSPVYPGRELGLTAAQRDAMQTMNEVAQRAVAKGIEELYAVYDALPAPVRERAIAMASGFDPASVAATTRFLASCRQPFDAPRELESLTTPALLIPGNDPEHPPEVAALYARHLPVARLAAAGAEPHRAIDEFCRGLSPAS